MMLWETTGDLCRGVNDTERAKACSCWIVLISQPMVV